MDVFGKNGKDHKITKEDSLRGIDPLQALEKDEVLIQLVKDYREAVERAKEKPDKLNRKGRELEIQAQENNLLTTYDYSIDAEGIEEFIGDKIQNGNTNEMIAKGFFLRKASKYPWTNDAAYKEKAIDFLSYVIPYLEKLEEEKARIQKEKKEMKERHRLEEAPLLEAAKEIGIAIVDLLSVHPLKSDLVNANIYERDMKLRFTKSHEIVEYEIRKLQREFTPDAPINLADAPHPDAFIGLKKGKIGIGKW